jgi:hypothetical protein
MISKQKTNEVVSGNYVYPQTALEYTCTSTGQNNACTTCNELTYVRHFNIGANPPYWHGSFGWSASDLGISDTSQSSWGCPAGSFGGGFGLCGTYNSFLLDYPEGVQGLRETWQFAAVDGGFPSTSAYQMVSNTKLADSANSESIINNSFGAMVATNSCGVAMQSAGNWNLVVGCQFGAGVGDTCKWARIRVDSLSNPVGQ